MINKINCLIENANEDFEINIAEWTETAKKLFKNLMTHEEVAKDSCLEGLEFEEVFFDITFTNAAETHELNRTYREKDYPADIITFALFADSDDDLIIDGRIVLGDIIIALDKVDEMTKSSTPPPPASLNREPCVAALSTKDEAKTFDYMLKFLIAHGVLHLLGFDHQTEEEYNFVVKHQQEAISEL